KPHCPASADYLDALPRLPHSTVSHSLHQLDLQHEVRALLLLEKSQPQRGVHQMLRTLASSLGMNRLLSLPAAANYAKLEPLSRLQPLSQVWIVIGLLILIVLGGAFLRLHGLDHKTLSHPEVYVPGIDLPEDISEPPPRLTFGWLVWWHFHDEPHPQG